LAKVSPLEGERIVLCNSQRPRLILCRKVLTQWDGVELIQPKACRFDECQTKSPTAKPNAIVPTPRRDFPNFAPGVQGMLNGFHAAGGRK